MPYSSFVAAAPGGDKDNDGYGWGNKKEESTCSVKYITSTSTYTQPVTYTNTIPSTVTVTVTTNKPSTYTTQYPVTITTNKPTKSTYYVTKVRVLGQLVASLD